MAMEVPRKRRRGRPKRRWLDNIRNDLSESELSDEPSSMEAYHKKHRPHIKVGKDAEVEYYLTQFWCMLNLNCFIGTPSHVDTVQTNNVNTINC